MLRKILQYAQAAAERQKEEEEEHAHGTVALTGVVPSHGHEPQPHLPSHTAASHHPRQLEDEATTHGQRDNALGIMKQSAADHPGRSVEVGGQLHGPRHPSVAESKRRGEDDGYEDDAVERKAQQQRQKRYSPVLTERTPLLCALHGKHADAAGSFHAETKPDGETSFTLTLEPLEEPRPLLPRDQVRNVVTFHDVYRHPRPRAARTPPPRGRSSRRARGAGGPAASKAAAWPTLGVSVSSSATSSQTSSTSSPESSPVEAEKAHMPPQSASAPPPSIAASSASWSMPTPPLGHAHLHALSPDERAHLERINAAMLKQIHREQAHSALSRWWRGDTVRTSVTEDDEEKQLLQDRQPRTFWQTWGRSVKFLALLAVIIFVAAALVFFFKSEEHAPAQRHATTKKTGMNRHDALNRQLTPGSPSSVFPTWQDRKGQQAHPKKKKGKRGENAPTIAAFRPWHGV